MEKKYLLLKELNDSTKPLTNGKLQKSLNISRRSVINYVNSLNDEYPNLITSTSNGYEIHNRTLSSSILKEIVEFPQFNDYEERKKRIFELLIFSRKRLSLEEMADELMISTTTLTNELNRLRNELKNQNMYLKSKKGIYYIVGEEKDKKKLIFDLLGEEMNHNNFNLSSLQSFFSYIDLEIIKKIIFDTLKSFDYYMDDFSILNYTLHLAICIETDYANNNQVSIQHIDLHYPYHVEKVIHEIYKKLKNVYPGYYTLNQISNASILMSTRIISKDINLISMNQINEIVGDEVCQILTEIIQSVYRNYCVDLKDDNFMVRFAMHLKNVILRVRNNIQIPVNNFISVRNDYPFIFEIAVYIASIVNKYVPNRLTECEISYIAIHLGMLMEERKLNKHKISCIIVLYNYHNIAYSLFEKLKENIEDIQLMDIVTSYEDIKTERLPDLILTTFQPDYSLNIPTVKISLMITNKEINNVKNTVDKIKQNYNTYMLSKNIRKFLKHDLFFVQTNFNNRDEVIDFMCDQMEVKGYVNHEFKKSIIEHEEYVSSAYRNISIPHTLHIMQNIPSISSVAVLINKHALSWGDNKVDIVFMLSLRPEDNASFRDIFNFITNLVNSEHGLKLLTNSSDYYEFVNILTNNFD